MDSEYGNSLLDALSTSAYQYQGQGHFLSVLSTETSRLSEAQTSSEYLIFSGVQYQTWLDDFVNSDDSLSAKSYSDYLPRSQILIVKMETAAHAQGHGLLNIIIIMQMEAMGLWGKLGETSGKTYFSRSGKRKRADRSYEPFHTPDYFSGDWPSIAIEAGFSETKAKLAADARWWLLESEGEVQIVLTTSIHQTKRDIVLEAWELAERPTRNDPEQNTPEVKQRVWIHQDGPEGAVQLTGNVPLRLPFCRALLREPQGNERDFVFSRNRLEEYAQLVWNKHESISQDA